MPSTLYASWSVGKRFGSATVGRDRGVPHMTSVEQPHGSADPQAVTGNSAGKLDRKRDALRSELLLIIDRANSGARTASRRARAWSSLYFLVGLPAAVLAAVAGAIALASTAGRVPAGIIALVSAGLTAAATFLDSATRQTSAENEAAGWEVLRFEARRLVPELEDDEWLVRDSRDAEAEAERRAQYESIRAQAEAARAEAEAERARAAEEVAKANAETALKGRVLAQMLQADDAAPQADESITEK